MFLACHSLCCFLAEHNLDALGQSMADAAPLSGPDFSAPFPLLSFLAWVEIKPVMRWLQSRQRCCPWPLHSSGTLPPFFVPQPTIVFKACPVLLPGQICMSSFHAALRYLLLDPFDATITGVSRFISLFFILL